jgi:hypothetical protein
MKKYGQGTYVEEQKRIIGQIVIDQDRLYVACGNKKTSTSIPLEKVSLIKYTRRGFNIKTKLSPVNVIETHIILPLANRKKLVKDIVKRFNLKKKFFRKIWTGQPVYR